MLLLTPSNLFAAVEVLFSVLFGYLVSSCCRLADVQPFLYVLLLGKFEKYYSSQGKGHFVESKRTTSLSLCFGTRRFLFLFLFCWVLVAVCLGFGFLDGGSPSVCTPENWKLSLWELEDCPPCTLLKKVYVRTCQTFPRVWWIMMILHGEAARGVSQTHTLIVFWAKF